MLELLIPSQTRIKLLTLFLMNPGREYYIREIERLTGENYAAIHGELANLESFGLLSKMRRGNQVFFSVNQDFFLYHELQQIILKTEGVGRVLRERLGEMQGVSCIFIYGSFAAGRPGLTSDIDVFIVGDCDEDTILTAIAEAEEKLGREINYTLMRKQEFLERQQKKEPFVTNVMREPRIILVGCHD